LPPTTDFQLMSDIPSLADIKNISAGYEQKMYTSCIHAIGKEHLMKKSKKIFLVVVGIITILWCSLAVSCLTTDTAYRVGYDIGSWLAE